MQLFIYFALFKALIALIGLKEVAAAGKINLMQVLKIELAQKYRNYNKYQIRTYLF